jgi:hypothetical protein
MPLSLQEERSSSAGTLAPIVCDCILCGRSGTTRAHGDALTHPNATQMSCYDPACTLPSIAGRRRRAHVAHYACVDAGRPWPQCTRPT